MNLVEEMAILEQEMQKLDIILLQEALAPNAINLESLCSRETNEICGAI